MTSTESRSIMPDPDCYKTLGSIEEKMENLEAVWHEFERRQELWLQQFELAREAERLAAAKVKEASLIAEAKLEATRQRELGFRDGSIWVLAKIGGAVVLFASLIGWVLVHGIPDAVIKIFK